MSILEKILKFFKKIKKQEYNGVSTITFRENYSIISNIYRGSIYPINENTGSIIFIFTDFNKFWDRFIVDKKKKFNNVEEEKHIVDDLKFITIRVINDKMEYIYTDSLKEKIELNSKNLKPVSDEDKKIEHFTNGMLEIGYWDFDKKIFIPFWSSRYTD